MSHLGGMHEQKFVQVILGKTQVHIAIAHNSTTMVSLQYCVMNLLTV